MRIIIIIFIGIVSLMQNNLYAVEGAVTKHIELTLCLTDRIAIVITNSGIMYLQGYGTQRVLENSEATYRFTEKSEGISANLGKACLPYAAIKIMEDGVSENFTWYYPSILPFNLKLYDKNFDSPFTIQVRTNPHVDLMNLPFANNNTLDPKYIIMPIDTWQDSLEGNNAKDFTITLDMSYTQNPDYEEPPPPEEFKIVDNPSKYIQIRSTVIYNVCISGMSGLIINEYGMSYMMSLSQANFDEVLDVVDKAINELGGNYDSSGNSCLNNASIDIKEIEISNAGNPGLSPQNGSHSWRYPGLLPYTILPLFHDENLQRKPVISHVENCYKYDGQEFYKGKHGDNNFDFANYVYLLSNNTEVQPKEFQLLCDVRFYISKD